jgi:hypothetical protein
MRKGFKFLNDLGQSFEVTGVSFKIKEQAVMSLLSVRRRWNVC